MTRLIDADGLKNKFWHGDLVPHNEMYHISEIMYAIDNAPTVEKRPQGEWIDRTALLEELEKEVKMADDWKTAHELFNVVKYFSHYGGAYEEADND